MGVTVKRKPALTDQQRALVVQSLTPAVIMASRAWGDLAALSDDTVIDDVDVMRDDMDFDGRTVTGIFTVYVYLNYGTGTDARQSTDEFPGSYSAHFDGDKVVIDRVDVLTASFYA